MNLLLREGIFKENEDGGSDEGGGGRGGGGGGGGAFVEIGMSGDGLPPSNTLLFEWCFGWSGVCHTLQTLQHTATHCNTLQHTATHCNTLQDTQICFFD